MPAAAARNREQGRGGEDYVSVNDCSTRQVLSADAITAVLLIYPYSISWTINSVNTLDFNMVVLLQTGYTYNPQVVAAKILSAAHLSMHL